MKLTRKKLIEKQAIIKAIFDDIYSKSPKPSEEYMTFLEEKDVILKKNSKKDKDGNSLTKQEGVNTVYEIENMESHRKEIEKLLEKYKETLEIAKTKDKEFQEYLKEEVNI